MSNLPQSVGLIGVGLVGQAIVQRLSQFGVRVTGSDLDREKSSTLREYRGRPVATASEVFQECETVLLSLPTSEIASNVLKEMLGHFDNPFRVETVIDTTTGNPEEMISNGEMLRKHNIAYLEATIAGSSSQLACGDAVLFFGGKAELIEKHGHLLRALAAKKFHLGDVGAASRFKLVHNLVLGLHRAVLAEGLTFAASMGFDPALVLDVLHQSPASSWVMETKGQKMVEKNWEPQARLAQHLKDVRLILDQANEYGARTPLSEIHAELLQKCVELGFGEADNSAILESFKID